MKLIENNTSSIAVKGKWNDPAYRRRQGRIAYYRKIGHSEAKIKALLADYDAKVAEAMKHAGLPAGAPPPSLAPRKKKADAEPLALEACPDCKIGFFIGNNSEKSAIGLDKCPRCGSRFYIMRGS